MLLPPVAPYSIPDSAVEFEAQLDPFDPALAHFDCGTDATALAINAFFRGGKWVMQKRMVALRFVVSGARLGYAAVRRCARISRLRPRARSPRRRCWSREAISFHCG